MQPYFVFWLLFFSGPHHRLTVWMSSTDSLGAIHRNLYSRGSIFRINGRFWFISAEAEDFGKLVKYRPPQNTLWIEDVGGRMRNAQGRLLRDRRTHVYFYHIRSRDPALFIVPMPIQDDGLEGWDE